MREQTRPSSSAESRGPGRPSRPALEFALVKLAVRAHGEAELSAKMERAGYTSSEIAGALDELKARRYLDDGAFAAGLARSAAERKSWGPARIRRALRERGISDQEIEPAVGAAFPDGERGPVSLALHRFRRRDRRGGRARERRARAYRHLVARGFSPAAVREALRAEQGAEEIETT